VSTCIGIIYYFAPDAEQDWEWITPGAVLATLLWLVASLGFKFYVANFANYNESYGSLGGVIVLMLWFYITALAVLTGAEMNAEIEHASPYGKDPGEKVPGQKKKIGRAAWREWDRRSRQGALPLSPPVGKPVARGAPSSPAPGKRSFAAFIILGVGLAAKLRKRGPVA
jgi:membrane protein